jgi:hypothetical protein
MKLFGLFTILFGLTYFAASAQQSFMTAESIKSLDGKWEEANLHPNPDFMESTLAKEFVWVHNHVSMIDTKVDVLGRTKTQKANGASDTKSRIQSEVKVAITGKTAIVTGITIVDRAPIPTKYHFMHTYVEVEGKCFLVGNHKVAIPEEE